MWRCGYQWGDSVSTPGFGGRQPVDISPGSPNLRKVAVLRSTWAQLAGISRNIRFKPQSQLKTDGHIYMVQCGEINLTDRGDNPV